jgi:hypothetical protein
MNGGLNEELFCNSNRVEDLNKRIYSRNIPSQKLQSQFDIRPVSTKYAIMPIFDRREISTVPIEKMPIYNIEHTFNPGNDQGPWSGFASNINNESRLRNQFFAQQRADQAAYIPSTKSDMYNVEVIGQPVQQPFPDLFANQVFMPFNPNVCGIGGNLFDNCVRQQLKNYTMQNACTS